MIQVKSTNKFLFVGDPHLDSVTPISRADNYRDVTIDKLEQILNLCIEREIELVIFAGDMFTNLDQSLIYMNRVLDTLQKFKNKGISLLTIIGNHDLPRNNMDLLKNSPIYTLLRSNTVYRLGEDPKVPLELNFNTYIYGLDYTKLEELENIKLDNSKCNILVAHYATDNTIPADNIPKEQLTKFDLVFLGHDHHQYDVLELDNGNRFKCRIFRPGSLTRTTREKFNLKRSIEVLEVVNINTNSKFEWDVITHKLEISKPEVAFRSEVFNEKAINFYDNNYNSLFNEEFFSNEAESLEEIIDNLPITIVKENKKYFKKELVRDETI